MRACAKAAVSVARIKRAVCAGTLARAHARAAYDTSNTYATIDHAAKRIWKQIRKRIWKRPTNAYAYECGWRNVDARDVHSFMRGACSGHAYTRVRVRVHMWHPHPWHTWLSLWPSAVALCICAEGVVAFLCARLRWCGLHVQRMPGKCINTFVMCIPCTYNMHTCECECQHLHTRIRTRAHSECVVDVTIHPPRTRARARRHTRASRLVPAHAHSYACT